MAIYGNPITMPIGGKAGSGAKMFLGVTLPKSIYYNQATEWLQLKANTKPAIANLQWDGQVVCGGALWEIYNGKALSYSLETGELLDTITLTDIEGLPCMGVTTDGESRIWIARAVFRIVSLPSYSKASYAIDFILYEFNINTKAVKKLYTASGKSVQTTNTTADSYYSPTFKSASFTIIQIGYIYYSNESNKIYFGKNKHQGSINYTYTSSSSSSLVQYDGTLNINANDSIFYEYDLTTNVGKSLAVYPATNNYVGQYFYEEGNFIYVGNGYTPYDTADKEKAIYKYSKEGNVWETVTTTFEGYTPGPFSYINLGDRILQMSKTSTGIFDPKTGNTVSSVLPVVPPDDTEFYACFKAYADNTLYLINTKGVYKCPFYSEVPADAPTVCKIYKGQKYHTLEPFEIPGKLSLTRTPQVADQDYEIKMYEYSSQGGQTIFIEDTGEE